MIESTFQIPFTLAPPVDCSGFGLVHVQRRNAHRRLGQRIAAKASLKLSETRSTQFAHCKSGHYVRPRFKTVDCAAGYVAKNPTSADSVLQRTVQTRSNAGRSTSTASNTLPKVYLTGTALPLQLVDQPRWRVLHRLWLSRAIPVSAACRRFHLPGAAFPEPSWFVSSEMLRTGRAVKRWKDNVPRRHRPVNERPGHRCHVFYCPNHGE